MGPRFGLDGCGKSLPHPMIPWPRFEPITTWSLKGCVCLFDVFVIYYVLLLCVDIVCISLEWCCVCWYVCSFVVEMQFVCVFNIIYSVL